MINDDTKLLLVSRNPVYINDDGNTSIIQNQYGDDESIYSISPSGHLQEHPLMGEVTLVPDVGVIVYDSEISAVKYQSLLQTEKGQEVFMTKIRENYRKHKGIWKTSGTVETGMYSLERLDNEIDPRCKDDLMEIRYLKTLPERNNALDRTSIKKVHQVSSNDQLGRILESYLVFKTPAVLKNKQKICNFRLVFDVYSVNGTTYVHASSVGNSDFISNNPLYVSPVNFYPVFYTRDAAYLYRDDIRNGLSEYYVLIGRESLRFERACAMRKHDEDIRNAAIIGGKFIVENGKGIFDGTKKVLAWFKSKKDNNN